MIKQNGSQKEPYLPYADFIEQVHKYSWENKTDAALSELLSRYAGLEEKRAAAYSIIKEIIRRKTGLCLFDSQLSAAYSMQSGKIAELPTGEGKTLSAVVAAAAFALQEKPVHILVFNDYLARRDYTANLPIYKACGLSCGLITEATNAAGRKTAYACDVVYVSAKEAAFDYLRDFLCMDKTALVFPSFSVALVDEADSILIDEARIPLVLAGNMQSPSSAAEQICNAVSMLSGGDVAINRLDNQVWLTDSGIDALETQLNIGSLYLTENAETLALIQAALEARFLVKKDRDYIVKDGEVLVVDESTGRVAENRRFPDLLQQAVEMKELKHSDAQSAVYNSIPMQSFLLQYPVLCGMTGTAASSASEFWSMYALKVDVIPPHLPCIRTDHADRIFERREEQVNEVLARIVSAHEKGQPVLIGTQSVRESEYYSGLLSQRRLPHRVLNARSDEQEAAIIAQAGMPYQITISTNMAGRGVDIKLGGPDGKQAVFVRKAGGLSIIGTGINRSVRIDNQLRGRAGRQGDPGESRYFICLKDLNAEAFTGLNPYSYKKYPKLVRRAQKIQEGRDAEARYMLERFSLVLEDQRRLISDYRMCLLLGQNEPEILKSRDLSVYEDLVQRHGSSGVEKAEKQLLLYFINMNWSCYLAAMEDMRSGIHLMVVGGKSPLDEYHRFAISAYGEMWEDIQSDVVSYMQKCKITENGIDMDEEGLTGATTTWTYMINESASQFSRIPHLMRSVSHKATGAVFTVQGIYKRLRNMFIRR